MNSFTKQKQTHRKGGKDKLGVWDKQISPIIKQINTKDLLYSTGSYIQYLVITYNEKEYEREYYVYVFPGILPVRTSEGRTCTN